MFNSSSPHCGMPPSVQMAGLLSPWCQVSRTAGWSSRGPYSYVPLIVAGAISGCGGGPDGDSILKDANKNNGERLANAYSFYQGLNQAGPPDIDTFKAFIQNDIPADKKKVMDIPSGSLDELFVSERDGQPFYIRPDVPVPTTGSVAQAVVIETQGVGGTIQVVYTGPKMVEAALADIEAYKSGDKDIVAGPPGIGQ